MDQDRKFLDTFIIVIGALLLFTLAMHFLAGHLADTYLDTDNSENPIALKAVSDRIAPVAAVRTTNDPAPQPAQAAAAGSDTQAQADEPADGAAVYQQACFACHGTGAAGAPKMGDAAAWASRIAKGMPMLFQHSIEGFQGDTGIMPPKGGRADLSDEQVKAAVEYMVSQSK